ncbi:MAG: cytochrome C [Gallionella sp.]|nr:cytochrome C [Gallionella sp.]
MKKISALLAILFCGYLTMSQSIADEGVAMDHHAMHHQRIMDERLSLGLSPKMKQHQLKNMRSHVVAIQSIVGHLANNEFDQAAQVAYSELGLTEEMRKMCSTMSDNEKFRQLGLAFHQSGDDLGDTLKKKDMKNSLQALRTTMDYCVQCHATFRQ